MALSNPFGSGGSSNPFFRQVQSSANDDITAPGDPDFSIGRAGSQDMFPAAAGQKRTNANRRQADKVADLMTQIGVSVPEEVMQLQESGMPAPEGSGFWKTVGMIAAPFRAINLGVQDVIAGREEDRNFASPTPKDYWNAFMGKDLEVMLEAGHRPSSGSETIALMGWEEYGEDASFRAKFGRGAVTFLYESLIDPTTYLSFGAAGLGRKVLGETGELVARQVTEEAIEKTGKTALHQRIASQYDEVFETTRKEAIDALDVDELALLDDLQVDELMKQIGVDAAATAKGMVLKQSRDEIVAPLVSRDFGRETIEEWKEFLPAYALGGARFSLPFLGKRGLKHGWVIPGTQGLGRDLIGNRVRNITSRLREKSSAFNKIGELVEQFGNNMDLDKSLLRAVAKGEISGGEYVMFRQAVANNLAYESLTQATARLQHESDVLGDLVFEEFGEEAMKKEARTQLADEMRAGLFQYINTGSNVLKIGDRLVAESTTLYREAQGFRDYARQTMDHMWETLKKTAPDEPWDEIRENYIPYMLKGENIDLINTLARNGAAVEKVLNGMSRGEGGAGAYFLQQLLRGAGGGGLGEAALGSSARLNTRKAGFTMVAKLQDESPVMLFDKAELGTDALARRVKDLTENMQGGYIDAVQLNDLIEPVLQDLVEKHGVHLPKGATFRPFSEDPFEAVRAYVEDMDRTIRMRGLLQVLEENGFIVKNRRIANVQGTLSNIAAHLNEAKVREALEHTMKRVNAQVGAAMGPEGAEALARQSEDVLYLSGSNRLKDVPGPRLQAVAKEARNQLGRKSGNMITRHVMPPVNYRSPSLRKKFLVDRVASDMFERKENAFYLFSAHDGNWYADLKSYYNALSDEAKKQVDDLGVNMAGDINYEAVNKLVNGQFVGLGNVLSDGTFSFRFTGRGDFADLMQRGGLEFGYVNDFGRIRVQPNAAPDSAWDLVTRETVFELSDVGAYQSAANSLFRTLRDAGDPMDQSEKLLERVVQGVRRNLRASGGKYYDKKKVPVRLEDFDWADSAMKNITGGVWLRDKDGVWRFGPKLPSDPTHSEAIIRLAREHGIRGGKGADLEDDLMGLLTSDDIVYLDSNAGDALRVRFEGTLADDIADEARWIGHRIGKKTLSLSPRRGADAFETIQDVLVDPDKLDDIALYNIAEQQFRQALDEGKSPLLHRQAIETYRNLYGDDFVAAQLKWTKDVLEIETAAHGLMQHIQNLTNMAARSLEDGGITDNVVFGIGGDSVKGFEKMIKEMQEYGKKLGIDSETFEILYSRGPGHVMKNGKAFVDPSIFNLGGELLENKSVHPSLNPWLEQMASNMMRIYTPEGIAQLKSTANAVTKWWKTMVTLPRATFHVRNLLGGVWNNQIIGVGASDYLRVRNGAMKIRAAMRNNLPLHEAIERLPEKDRLMFRAAYDSGLLDLSFSSAEFRGMAAKRRSVGEKTLGALNVLDPEDFALARAGAFFMESIEDFLRVSAFATWFDPKNPASAQVAKEMALNVHFDYKNLTKWETGIKKIVPFFVWQRRNLPLQLQQMVERPGLMTRYQHLMNAYDDQFANVEQDQYGQSQWMAGQAIGTDIVLNEDSPFWARLMVDPDIPVKDLYDLTRGDNMGDYFYNGVEYALSSLGPIYSFVQDVVEQKEYGSVNAPAPLNAVLGQMARTGFLDTTTDGDVQMPYLMRTLYYMMAPWSRELEDMGVLPQSDPRRRTALGMTEEEGLYPDDVGGMLQRIGLTLGRGVGVQAQTPRDTASQAWQGQQELNEIVNNLFKQSPEFKELWENS